MYTAGTDGPNDLTPAGIATGQWRMPRIASCRFSSTGPTPILPLPATPQTRVTADEVAIVVGRCIRKSIWPRFRYIWRTYAAEFKHAFILAEEGTLVAKYLPGLARRNLIEVPARSDAPHGSVVGFSAKSEGFYALAVGLQTAYSRNPTLRWYVRLEDDHYVHVAESGRQAERSC